jgi:hypothetical protein
MTFAAATRAAAVQLLKDYAADVDIKLQVYPGRPASLYPPTAFVDRMSEAIDYRGVVLFQRTPEVDVVVLHGVFDSLEAVAQRDAFVDGFLAWVANRVHAAGANTTIGLVGVEDEPTFVPDWLAPEQQRIYYGTRLTLRGYAEAQTV